MPSAMQVGIKVVHRQLADTVSQADVESAVKATCDDQSIDGILVQVRNCVCSVKTYCVLSMHCH